MSGCEIGEREKKILLADLEILEEETACPRPGHALIAAKIEICQEETMDTSLMPGRRARSLLHDRGARTMPETIVQ